MNFDLPILAPSILAADFSQLGTDIKDALDGGMKWVHCDIMDGHFVPNISYGPSIVKAAHKAAPDAFIDVHLMIENPDAYIKDYADAGADLISVHYETCPHLHRSIQHIKNYGIMAGVVVNPATSLHLIEPILPYVDLVLIMSVNPGFGGQSFIESTYQKLEKLAAMRKEKDLGFLIEVDGGVSLDNITKVAESGADILVAGSAVFKADNISKSVAELIKKLPG
ncbi:MAG: ribulose-phosphate 3-epimerase [Balneolaceae bacterium]|nr:ribulose-phosphate 3-epimerase [Balneolaceae bacterium]